MYKKLTIDIETTVVAYLDLSNPQIRETPDNWKKKLTSLSQANS